MSHYITKEILRTSLRKGLSDNTIEVTNFHISEGNKPGDNYASDIYRVKVIYRNVSSKQNVLSLIIKSMPNEGLSKLIHEIGFIQNEINVYADMMPRLQKYLGSTIVAPKCYDIFMEPHVNIVFQDLIAGDYVCSQREIGLDEAHLAMALGKIAKFHVASVSVLKQDPSTESNYQMGFFAEKAVKNPLIEGVFTKNLKCAALVVSQIPGYERFRDKLLKIYENFHDFAVKCAKFDPNVDFKVLTHGDLWINNFLYKYDKNTGSPVDIIFVDFQISGINGLALDLAYLFVTSANFETLSRRLELIEKYYYPAFVAEMKRLHLEPIPSLANILRQFERREMYSLICLIGVLPLVVTNREEAKTNSLSQFVDDEIAERKGIISMSSTRFKESIKYILDCSEKQLDEAIQNF